MGRPVFSKQMEPPPRRQHQSGGSGMKGGGLFLPPLSHRAPTNVYQAFLQMSAAHFRDIQEEVAVK